LAAQALREHSYSFNFFSLFQDLLCTPKVNVGGRQVVEALMVPAGVVLFNERANLTFEAPGSSTPIAARASSAPSSKYPCA